MSYRIEEIENDNSVVLCEPIAVYSQTVHKKFKELYLFDDFASPKMDTDDIKVVELFAGVGGFRIGLERASKRFRTIWNNQWEPATKRQDASLIYCRRFGVAGHSNEDIGTVPTSDIPDCDLLCGGFPCQDYSVATTLLRSGGIEGKKGVLWWQIYRILKEKGSNRPKYLMLENVDRLLNSPAKQRGRDFAIILSSLDSLGYAVEWRVVNAAEYGMPQRRRRTYIMAYKDTTPLFDNIATLDDKFSWITDEGVMANAFTCERKDGKSESFFIGDNIAEVSENFNRGKKASPFRNSGLMYRGQVFTLDTLPVYDGHYVTLGEILVDEKDVPDEFFISDTDLQKWEYQKGAKHLKRVNKTTGFEYNYSEGAMAFPDCLEKASRTIITGEGGAAPSRFKHIIKTESGRYRRLVPVELERLNMFPDNHTLGATDLRRAFLMGNALVTGIVERLALVLIDRM
ncbi:MAG: DNA (cytosine-5-)-methyltransferase [Prevotella sp.]